MTSPDTLKALAAEYRESMSVDVLRAWAKDAAAILESLASADEGVPVVAERIRYRSEPGMIGHYPWAYNEKVRGKRAHHELEPLVRRSDHLAALSAQSTAADEMVVLLRDARDDVNDCLNAVLPNAGHERYDRRIKDYQDRLARIDAALAAHEAKHGGKG